MGLNIWTTSGTMMLFYLATLQSIPTDVYEAAAIDGASRWRTFWRITFPLLKPGHFFVAVLSVIGCLKIFDQAFIVSGGKGGPAYSTETAVLYLYQKAINDAALGLRRRDRASSCSSVIFVLTLIQRLLFGTRGGRLLMATDRDAAPHIAAPRQLALDEDPATGAPLAATPGPARGSLVGKLLLYLLMALASFYLLPFVWSVSTSFKTLHESVSGLSLIPLHPTLAGYREAFTTGPSPATS